MLKRTLHACPLVVLAASMLGACTDGGSGPIDPLEPVPGEVIADVSGTLAAEGDGTVDTIDVVIPDGRLMGMIFESSHQIVARYGLGQFDLVHSGFGGPFAAIVPQVGTGDVQLLVHRSDIDEVVEVEYRIRVIAVNEAPEHASQQLRPGTTFRREYIDPPLDLDVFAIDFEEGERFFVEIESDEEAQVTVGVLPPGGASYYVFIATGPERARSQTFEAAEEGEHLLVVYSAGLAPDVEASYRFRVVEAQPE